MNTNGLSGVYYRDGGKTHSRDASPINPQKIEVFTGGTINGISRIDTKIPMSATSKGRA